MVTLRRSAPRGRLVAVLAVGLSLLGGCAPSLVVTRTHAPALGDASVIAIAASGPYAMDLVAGVRARLAPRVKVEACVVGCPSVGLYASLTLTPGPHEGRVERTCQAEVYTGESWVAPKEKRGALVLMVREPEGCVDAVAKLLLEPRTERVRVGLDARGPLEPIAKALHQGNPGEARRLLDALLAKEPGHAGGWYDLGVLAEASGELDAARRHYERARASSPDEWLSRQLAQRP